MDWMDIPKHWQNKLWTKVWATLDADIMSNTFYMELILLKSEDSAIYYYVRNNVTVHIWGEGAGSCLGAVRTGKSTLKTYSKSQDCCILIFTLVYLRRSCWHHLSTNLTEFRILWMKSLMRRGYLCESTLLNQASTPLLSPTRAVNIPPYWTMKCRFIDITQHNSEAERPREAHPLPCIWGLSFHL